MRKNLFKRSFAWFGVVLLAITTLAIPYFSLRNAYAVDANYQNAADELRTASRIQRIVNVARLCAGISADNWTKSYVKGKIDPKNAMSYWSDASDWGVDNTDMPAGPWLEDIIQDKVDDGAIWCWNGPNNILQVFADYLGYDLATEVACDGDKPGILTAAVNGEYTHAACSSLIGKDGYTFQWRTKESATNHIKYLYEKYKTDNPRIGQYLPPWDTVDDFMDQAISYYVYYDDFWWACANGDSWQKDSEGLPSGTPMPEDLYWDTTIPVLNTSTGEYNVWRNYKKECTAGDDNSCSWSSSVIGESAGARSCTDVISKLRSYGTAAGEDTKTGADSLIEEARERAKTTCNDIATKTGYEGKPELTVTAQLELAKNIIADPETARETVVKQNPNASETQIKAALEEVKKRAEHVKSTLEPLIASGIYWEEGTGDKEGEIVCKAWPTVFNGDITPESGFAVEQTEWTDPKDNPKSEGDNCYAAGLESMSWILCPATTNMSSAVHGIDTLLDQWLSTDTGLYENGSGAAIAWSYFRDIANILIIIILLVIIFSQLTGYGIDNYGIKRMLPRLIIMAVLINLSLIICQIAIDLSNILGQGLNNFFNSIGNTIIGNNTTAGNMVEEGVAGLVTSLLAAAAGVAAGSGAIIGGMSLITGGGGGVMIIVSLILALLVALVAVLMFFVMLGARMIIIIMFTAIAPVAFACYILPNTQGLFKKWWNIFKTALVVYPICGALYGMSYVIKATIFTGSNGLHLWMAVVAVCAPFLPFLMLPGLLKGALAALGAVGGTLAMLGNGLRGSLASGQKSIKESDAYKNEKVQQQRNQNKWAAGYYRNGNRMWNDKGERLGKDGKVMVGKDGKAKRVSGFGQFIRGGQTGIAAATARHLKDEESINAEKRVLSDAGRMSAEAEIEAKGKTQMIGAYESLLNNGAATINNGKTTVNATNPRQVGAYHREALGRYQAAARAGDTAAMNEAAAQIKAAQNILSKTDPGRAEVVKNLQGSARNGQMEGLNVAAGHLLSEFGNQYKSTDRGAFDMLNNLSDGRAAEEIQSKLDTPILDENGNIKIDEKSGKEMWDITAGGYSTMGTKAYTPESLAGADDRTIQNMALAVEQRKLSDEGLSDIQRTAYQAIENAKNGRLNVKPEVMRQLERIAAGYDPNSIKITHTPSTPPSSSTDGSGAGGGYGVDTSTWD